MDGIEQLDRFGSLVRLQPPDLVHADVGMAPEQCRPFSERFLDPVLAEVALARGNQRLDLFDRTALTDRDQLDVGGIAPGELRCGSNLRPDSVKAGCGC